MVSYKMPQDLQDHIIECFDFLAFGSSYDTIFLTRVILYNKDTLITTEEDLKKWTNLKTVLAEKFHGKNLYELTEEDKDEIDSLNKDNVIKPKNDWEEFSEKPIVTSISFMGFNEGWIKFGFRTKILVLNEEQVNSQINTLQTPKIYIDLHKCSSNVENRVIKCFDEAKISACIFSSNGSTMYFIDSESHNTLIKFTTALKTAKTLLKKSMVEKLFNSEFTEYTKYKKHVYSKFTDIIMEYLD